ncbi:MAG: hypothetical protein WC683_10280 [bacterium]
MSEPRIITNANGPVSALAGAYAYYRVALTLTAPMLGTVSADPEVYRQYVLGPALAKLQSAQDWRVQADADELEDELKTLPPLLDEEGEQVRVRSTFHRNADNEPCIYGYLVMANLQEACQVLRMGDTKGPDGKPLGLESKKLTTYQKSIRTNLFVLAPQRLITLNAAGAEWPIPADPAAPPYDAKNLPIMVRPLRANTPQGPRVAIAASDFVPAGTTLNFHISLLNTGKVTEAMLIEWLDYGAQHGLGQWRAAQWGTYYFELEPVDRAAVADLIRARVSRIPFTMRL